MNRVAAVDKYEKILIGNKGLEVALVLLNGRNEAMLTAKQTAWLRNSISLQYRVSGSRYTVAITNKLEKFWSA
jgi:hypothetical protein